VSADKTADTVKLNLRLPKALHKRLRQQAKRDNVSLNTTIINQLEDYEPPAIREVYRQGLAQGAVDAAIDTLLSRDLSQLEKLVARIRELRARAEERAEALADARKSVPKAYEPNQPMQPVAMQPVQPNQPMQPLGQESSPSRPQHGLSRIDAPLYEPAKPAVPDRPTSRSTSVAVPPQRKGRE